MTKLGLIPFVLLAIATGCKDNSQYCQGNPGNNCQNMWDASGCSTSAQCSGATPVCDIGTRACVQCSTSEAAACTGTTPVCGANEMCEACTTHAQCSASSDVCLPTGACADTAQVAYVSASGTGTACTKASPCPLLKDAITKSLPYVKIAANGAANDTAPVTIDGKTVTILADPGAKLDRDGDGAVLVVQSANTNVTIYDLEITGATGAAGADGVDVAPNGGVPKLTLVRVNIHGNQGFGLSCTGGSVTVAQSTVATNQSGGISMTGSGTTFDITNNFIFRNGNSTTASIGGASLAPSGTSVFAFNTVVDNQIQNSGVLSGGVFCDTSGFTAPNNIIVRNFVNNDATKTNANTSGICTYPTSTVAMSVTGLNFKSPDNGPQDYHLTSGSSAIDQATTNSNIAIDFDGDTRPQGSAKDRGADEFKP